MECLGSSCRFVGREVCRLARGTGARRLDAVPFGATATIVLADMGISWASTVLFRDARLSSLVVIDGLVYVLRLVVALVLLRLALPRNRPVARHVWLRSHRWRADLRWTVRITAIGASVIHLA